MWRGRATTPIAFDVAVSMLVALRYVAGSTSCLAKVDSAGSRSILGMLRVDGVTIGRFRVRRLMRELGLVSKQPGSHAYKQATVERPDIPN